MIMKTIKVLLVLSLFWLLVWNAFASTFEKIEAIDNNTVELTASKDVIFSDTKVDGELKLLKDVWVSFSSKDPQNSKKVLLNLSSDLTINTSYSLIAIIGSEWSIDFKIAGTLIWEILNVDLIAGEIWIQKVNVVDKRTIELYFTSDLIKDQFEFKILSEVETTGIKSDWVSKLTLEIAKNIEKSTNYILMVSWLKDVDWKVITFNEDLYEFKTTENLVKAVSESQIISVISDIVTSTWNLNEIAARINKTPEAGTTSLILVVLTLLWSLAFFFRKKIIK